MNMLHTLSLCAALVSVVVPGTSSEANGNFTDPDTLNRIATPLSLSSPDLSPDEIRTVTRLALASYPAEDRHSLRFASVHTFELTKEEFLSAKPVNRWAYALVFNLKSNRLDGFTMELTTTDPKTTVPRIVQRRRFPDGSYPPVLQTESDQAEQLVRASPEWRAAMKARGLDPAKARFDVWAPGPIPTNASTPERFLRAITFYQDGLSRFWYWTVVEGLIATVDLRAGVVASIVDDGTAKTLAPSIKESLAPSPPFASSSPSPSPLPLKPLTISQPSGSSVVVNAASQHISWYKWNLDYAFHPRDGLQLFHVTYKADCVQSSVLHKLSLGEIFVPYGASPNGTWRWRNAMDVSEYAVGSAAAPLRRGFEVPTNAMLLPCLRVHEVTGEPQVLNGGCIGVYERSSSLNYKYVDFETGDTEARPGRELVLVTMAQIGNYDYALEYVLRQGGSLLVSTRLTGIVLPRGVPLRVNNPTCVTDCAVYLNDNLVGPVHQHFFTYRIDLDVDGQKNHVLEVDVTPDDAQGSFSAKKTLIAKETARDYVARWHRSWHVVNTGSRNRFGSPRGYALKPVSPITPYVRPPSPILARAPFVQHHLWVTKYKDNEQTPGARFTRYIPPPKGNGNGVPAGLPTYIQNQEPIAGEDVVLWYTFGVTHQSRPEQWPIMNVYHAQGFTLEPFNFMSQNEEMPLKSSCP